jgi:hypothetical protein
MLVEMNEYQARAVAALAAKAAGLNLKEKEISVQRVGDERGIHIGSFGGMPVNLHMIRHSLRMWELPDILPDPKVCRWAVQYPTYEELICAVPGIRIAFRDGSPVVEKKNRPLGDSGVTVVGASGKLEAATDAAGSAPTGRQPSSRQG